MNNYKALVEITNITKDDDRISKALSLVEINSLETFSHTLQVAFLVSNYIQNYKGDFTDKEEENLIIASLFHDIGKLDISPSILKKADALTEKEFKEIQKHPVYGAKTIKKMGFNNDICNLVEFHHYRGEIEKSYPKLNPILKTDKKFMKNLQVLSICDIFSAIVQPRAYKMARPKEFALAEIQKEGFDLEIFVKFKKMIESTSEIMISSYSDFTN